MRRWLIRGGLALALCTTTLEAREGPRRGKIKKVPAATIAITADGKRTRKAWGNNLHTILQKLQLFPGPYKQVVNM